MQPMEVQVPSCCCGRTHCAYLERNNLALEGLEKDLRNAAQIGQVCLTLYSIYTPEEMAA